METYQNSQLLNYKLIRLSKAHSSFLYFILESNEGLCFYSTIDFETGQAYRDIEVYSTIEFKKNLDDLLGHLSKSIQFEILKDEDIKDSL